jgi:DNA invertase Pin-like site-specific DNA recombinase
MTTQPLVFAAQYLRKSTEHQQYSFENQAGAILDYATRNGFRIIETYSDAASGMALNRRKGLRKLLHDVSTGAAGYKAILVYDVSRWGRFLDADESAYYEFVCKMAGMSVHYCAEPFKNDGTLVGFLFKSMKRMMAGEYSRELSVKILAGSRRIAENGFKCGGVAGYGLRRMLVSKDHQPKQQLEYGERKSIQEDRVVLVPGPKEETDCVREIYRLFLDENLGPKAIAAELNRRGIKYAGLKVSEWYPNSVDRILRSPKYAGCVAYGRTSKKLNTPCARLPKETWVTVPDAWEAIVDPLTFERARTKLGSRPELKSDAQLLEELRALGMRVGRLKSDMVTSSAGLPSMETYRKRFGSFSNALLLIGQEAPRLSTTATRKKTAMLKAKLVDEIVMQSNQKVSIVRRNGQFRPKLRLRNGVLVSVHVCLHVSPNGKSRWFLARPPGDRDRLTLVARLDSNNQDFLDFHLIPKVPRRCNWTIRPDDDVFKDGVRLKSLAEFATAALVVQKLRRPG